MPDRFTHTDASERSGLRGEYAGGYYDFTAGTWLGSTSGPAGSSYWYLADIRITVDPSVPGRITRITVFDSDSSGPSAKTRAIAELLLGDSALQAILDRHPYELEVADNPLLASAYRIARHQSVGRLRPDAPRLFNLDVIDAYAAIRRAAKDISGIDEALQLPELLADVLPAAVSLVRSFLQHSDALSELTVESRDELVSRLVALVALVPASFDPRGVDELITAIDKLRANTTFADRPVLPVEHTLEASGQTELPWFAVDTDVYAARLGASASAVALGAITLTFDIDELKVWVPIVPNADPARIGEILVRLTHAGAVIDSAHLEVVTRNDAELRYVAMARLRLPADQPLNSLAVDLSTDAMPPLTDDDLRRLDRIGAALLGARALAAGGAGREQSAAHLWRRSARLWQRGGDTANAELARQRAEDLPSPDWHAAVVDAWTAWSARRLLPDSTGYEKFVSSLQVVATILLHAVGSSTALARAQRAAGNGLRRHRDESTQQKSERYRASAELIARQTDTRVDPGQECIPFSSASPILMADGRRLTAQVAVLQLASIVAISVIVADLPATQRVAADLVIDSEALSVPLAPRRDGSGLAGMLTARNGEPIDRPLRVTVHGLHPLP